MSKPQREGSDGMRQCLDMSEGSFFSSPTPLTFSLLISWMEKEQMCVSLSFPPYWTQRGDWRHWKDVMKVVRQQCERVVCALIRWNPSFTHYLLIPRFLRRQVGGSAVRCDGGEGESGRGVGREGAGDVPVGLAECGRVWQRGESSDLHHPASEDDLLQAVAGGAVPAGPHQVQTHLPLTHRPRWAGRTRPVLHNMSVGCL